LFIFFMMACSLATFMLLCHRPLNSNTLFWCFNSENIVHWSQPLWNVLGTFIDDDSSKIELTMLIPLERQESHEFADNDWTISSIYINKQTNKRSACAGFILFGNLVRSFLLQTKYSCILLSLCLLNSIRYELIHVNYCQHQLIWWCF